MSRPAWRVLFPAVFAALTLVVLDGEKNSMIGHRLTIAAALAITIMAGTAGAQRTEDEIFTFRANASVGSPGTELEFAL